MIRGLVLVLLVACRTGAPAVPTWSPPPAGAYRAGDAFHVAVADTHATWSNPPSFWPCPLDGATFLCGTAHVLAIRGARIERSAALERGRATGIVEAMVGRWPDDAWLVVRTEMGAQASCGHCRYVAYRWHGDAWARVAELADWYPGRAAAWLGMLFILRDHPRLLDVIGTKITPLARQIVADSRRAVVPSVVATPTMLVVSPDSCGTTPCEVARWTQAGSVVERPIPAPADASPGPLELVATAKGPTIIGSSTTYIEVHGEPEQQDTPIALRFEDGRWVSREPPGHRVLSYAAAPDGTEWAIVDEMEPAHAGVFARAPGSAWQQVGGWQREALGYGASPLPARVWTAEGSVWLEVTVDGACAGIQGCENRSVLLRTGPASPPVLLERDRRV